MLNSRTVGMFVGNNDVGRRLACKTRSFVKSYFGLSAVSAVKFMSQ